MKLDSTTSVMLDVECNQLSIATPVCVTFANDDSDPIVAADADQIACLLSLRDASTHASCVVVDGNSHATSNANITGSAAKLTSSTARPPRQQQQQYQRQLQELQELQQQQQPQFTFITKNHAPPSLFLTVIIIHISPSNARSLGHFFQSSKRSSALSNVCL
jgi:hypothetical protein